MRDVMEDNWDDMADTNHDWDDTADTNPAVVLTGEPALELPNAIPEAIQDASGEGFSSSAALAAAGKLHLHGRGGVHAPSTELRFVPEEGAVQVWIGESSESDEPRCTLQRSEWGNWVRRIVSALSAETAAYSPAVRASLSATSGSRGALELELPCVGGQLSYSEAGALTDRPVRVAQEVLDLLSEHGIQLDPNHVPD